MTHTLAPYLDPLPLIAVLRGITPEEIPAVGAALVAHGFRILEVPLNSPRPYDSIARLARRSARPMPGRCGNGHRGEEVAGRRGRRAPDRDAALRHLGDCEAASGREGSASRGCDADGGLCGARRRGRGLEDVSVDQLPASALKAWRAVLPRETLVFRGRRHPSRKHGTVLGRRAPTGSAPGSNLYTTRRNNRTCASAAAAYAAAFRALQNDRPSRGTAQ